MLLAVKKALRITHNHLDDELMDLIEACKIDLSISGVVVIDESDALIIHAVKIYCKAFIKEDDQEKYLESYKLIKTHMALCGDYNAAQ